MTLCTAKRFGKAKATAPSPFYLVSHRRKVFPWSIPGLRRLFGGLCRQAGESRLLFLIRDLLRAVPPRPFLSAAGPGRLSRRNTPGLRIGQKPPRHSTGPKRRKKISPQEKLTQSRLSGSAAFWWKRAVRRKRGRCKQRHLRAQFSKKNVSIPIDKMVFFIYNVSNGYFFEKITLRNGW